MQSYTHLDYHVLLVAMIQLVACLYIAVRGISVLNHMNSRTRLGMRLAYVMLTAGGGYGVVTCWPEPDVLTTLFACGVALFLLNDLRQVRHG